MHRLLRPAKHACPPPSNRHGALTFYLSKQQEIDEYLQRSEAAYEAARLANHEELRQNNPDLLDRLIKAKEATRQRADESTISR